MQTILFFPREIKNLRADKIRASFEESCLRRWNLQIVEARMTPTAALQLIRFWNPIGCIVNNDTLPASLFHGIPTLFQHRDPRTLPRYADYFNYDENEIAALAARELLALNLASYVYVSDVENEFWDASRRTGFVRAMTLNGKGVSVFTPPKGRNMVRLQSALARHLADLPKPIGVFAAYDVMAEHVFAACAHAGLGIPDDVAVLGVDNLESICETLHPSLTSIDCEAFPTKLPYGDILQARIDNPKRPRTELKIKPHGIVRRASTRRFTRMDPLVATACEEIRKRACDGLAARDVAALFPCSRRMAEIRFRAATGQSILEAIRAERQRVAESLVEDGHLPTEAIAARCGYAAFSSVYRLLRPQGRA